MKLHLLLLCSFITLVTACSSPDSSTSRNGNDGTISETALPKGKLIVEEETRPVNTQVNNGGSINGYDGTDTDNKTTDIANTPQDKKDNLKRRYKNLLVFHADDTMKVKKSYYATLILGKDQVYGDVKSEVISNSNAKDQNVQMDSTTEIGTKMRVELKDDGGSENKGFEIELLGGMGANEQRITEKRRKAIWTWKISPLTAGQHHLKLSIGIIEKDDEVVNLPTKTIPVIIFAEEESFMSKAGTFFEKNFQWMLATLLIPLFMGWYNARMRHKFDRRMAQEREQKERQQATNYQPPPQQQSTTEASKSNETTPN